MNTATRSYPIHGENARYLSYAEHKSIWNIKTSILIVMLLLSAFSIVYLRDLNRRLFINYQNLLQNYQQDEVEQGKLLLEQSTWSTEQRILTVARDQLGMITPTASEIVIVTK